MRYILITMIVSFLSSSAFAKEMMFSTDPDVYRGAYYGHLIKGSVEVEGVTLSPGESVVYTVSYVHALKDDYWYRSVKVSSKVLCRIQSTDNPEFYVAEIDAHLSLDGKKVIKVLPLFTPESDPNIPDNKCIKSK